jgi:hypothetical protein
MAQDMALRAVAGVEGTNVERRSFLKLGVGALVGESLTRNVAAALPGAAALVVNDANVKYFGVFRETAPQSTKPRGWIRELLTRQMNGLAKHHAVSGYPFDTCLWAGRIPSMSHGDAWWPYEQTGYLLDGMERLGLVMEDADLLGLSRANFQYVLASAAADGTLGPTHIGAINWPHAVFFRSMTAEFDATGKTAIAAAIARHYKGRPVNYGRGFRDCANVETMVRLYGVSGDPEMLALAKRTYANFDQTHTVTDLAHLSDDKPCGEHGVTFNETAKQPAILYLATGEQAMLDASLNAYRKVDRDDMLASGLHSAEEKLRGNDQGLYHETCNVSDYTWSVGYLLMATGDASWADHIEKTTFNAGLGSIGKDFKAHQYFSSPNQVVARHGIVSSYNVNRVAFRPGHDTECCSGNVHRFLPNYVMRQWMRTPQGGVVAALYGASVHKTTVRGVPVAIEQKTEYPFSSKVTLTVRCSRPVAFPLHVRIPGWAEQPEIKVNGRRWPGLCQPASFETIDRTFANGDTVEMTFPMRVRMRLWGAGAVSIERGPLVYSLKIDEAATPVFGEKTAPDFPAWDILPASPWNYGLQVKEFDIASQVQVVERTVEGFPWDVGNSPIELRLPARRISAWTLPEKTNPALPEKPVGDGEVETVTLVPYGATRIRLTVFPLLG